MRVSIWIKKKSIKTQTSYHQISEKMGTVLNLENISDQKFQSKIIFPILKLKSFLEQKTINRQKVKKKRDQEEHQKSD